MILHETGRFQPQKIDLRGIGYEGVSVGSEVTVHGVSGCLLDIGQALLFSTVMDKVFITHTHRDHVFGVAPHVARRQVWRLPPATYYISECDYAPLREVLRAAGTLYRTRALDDVDLQVFDASKPVPVAGGLFATPFVSTHRVPTHGVALSSEKKKLHPSLVGASREQIIAAKASGAPVDVVSRCVELAYPGDTNARVFDHPVSGEVVRSAVRLILECTFADDVVSAAEAAKTGHIHVDDLVRLAGEGAFDRVEVVLLTHFSARYLDTGYITRRIGHKLRGTALEGKYVLLLGSTNF